MASGHFIENQSKTIFWIKSVIFSYTAWIEFSFQKQVFSHTTNPNPPLQFPCLNPQHHMSHNHSLDQEYGQVQGQEWLRQVPHCKVHCDLRYNVEIKATNTRKFLVWWVWRCRVRSRRSSVHIEADIGIVTTNTGYYEHIEHDHILSQKAINLLMIYALEVFEMFYSWRSV